IPAPASGCPGGKRHQAHGHGAEVVSEDGEATGTALAGGPGGARGRSPAAHLKIPVCHATGSLTNPFVEITIPLPAMLAHLKHHDGDHIMLPFATCSPGALLGDTMIIGGGQPGDLPAP